jgi:hypothetical protein
VTAEEPPEGLSDYERWQVAVAIAGLALSVGFTLWLMLRDDASVMGKLRWWRDQQRRKQQAERAFRKDLNHVFFEAWEVLTGANAV